MLFLMMVHCLSIQSTDMISFLTVGLYPVGLQENHKKVRMHVPQSWDQPIWEPRKKQNKNEKEHSKCEIHINTFFTKWKVRNS